MDQLEALEYVSREVQRYFDFEINKKELMERIDFYRKRYVKG